MEEKISVSEKIAIVAAQASFDFWKDLEFRKMIDFERISQTDKDRIFNELEVTVLGLVALHAEHQPVLIDLERQVIHAFLNMYIKLGVEEGYVKIWKKLINLRFKEYKRDFRLALKESKNWEEIEDENFRVIWARVETLTIDGLSHIRRGKVEKDDPLWSYLRKWLTMMEVVMSRVVQDSGDGVKVGNC